MSKRRRGERQTHHQVPSLRSLAQHAVHIASGRPVGRPHHNFPNVQRRMDTPMTESRSSGTQTNKRLREGAEQVGQGLQVTVPRSVPNSYNNNYTVQLNYADNYRHDIAQSGAASAYQAFRMSGIFDPDRTGTGHQPFFRDMWASQYDYFTVISVDYTIRMYNAFADPVTYTAVGTSAQRVGAVNVTQFLGTTNPADITTPANGIIYPAAEMKNTITKFLVPEDVIELSGSLTQADFIVDAKDADSDNTWIAVGSNPTVDRIFGYVISPAQWTALTGVNETPYSAIQVQVILNYTVQFTQINQSLRSVSS